MDNNQLTAKEKELLLILKEWYNLHLYGPSLADLQRITGLDRAGLWRRVMTMIEKGILVWPTNDSGGRIARALRIADDVDTQL